MCLRVDQANFAGGPDRPFNKLVFFSWQAQAHERDGFLSYRDAEWNTYFFVYWQLVLYSVPDSSAILD